MPEITIAVESPRQPGVLELIESLDRYHIDIYPAEANHLLDIESLCTPQVRFLVARRGADVLGIGALWLRRDLGFGEVKRMYVRPETRGTGLGRRLLGEVERIAREERLPSLMLETGTLNTEALGLYAKHGFVRRGPFGDYEDHPLCVFMEKAIA